MLSLDYISGYFDGEGTLFVSKSKPKNRPNAYYKWTAALHTGDAAVLKAIHETLGGYYVPEIKAEKTVNVIMGRISWENDKAVEVLSQLKLIGKEPQRLYFLESFAQAKSMGKQMTEAKTMYCEEARTMMQTLKRHNLHSDKYL